MPHPSAQGAARGTHASSPQWETVVSAPSASHGCAGQCCVLTQGGIQVCPGWGRVIPEPRRSRRYRRYAQRSRIEFSCAKPSYSRLDTAWISNRSVCYLASGKPVIAQQTGTSQFLPNACGPLRFRTIHEAAHHLETVEADYKRHCHETGALAEEYFYARTVCMRALDAALG